MICIICKHGQTKDQLVTVTFDRDKKTFVFKDVPAQVCENCGEQYVDGDTTKKLLDLAHSADKLGHELTISSYNAA